MRSVLPNVTALFLLLFASRAQMQENARTVSVEITGENARAEHMKETALRVINSGSTDLRDTAALGETAEALRMCRLFETVDVKQEHGHTTFLLKPAQYVRDVRIKRELPLFEDDVEKIMSTYPGDIFLADMLTRQDSLVTSLYQREGFISPQVTVTSKDHRSGEDKVVVVQVQAGKYFRLRKLSIAGNRALSDFRLKRRMKSWRTSLFPGSSGRFVESVLREDLKALTELYRSKGFADIQIEDSVSTDVDAHAAVVVLTVHEGDRYRVRFSPRKERGYRRSILRKDITLFKEGNRNNLGVSKSVRAIESRMRNGGFLNARVVTSDTVVQRRRFTERFVDFSITRGPRTSVSSITIRGNTSLDEETVRGQMLHVDKGRPAKRAYVPDKFLEDTYAVQMLYRSRGFLRAEASSSVDVQGGSAALVIDIKEGPRTLIGSVQIDAARFKGVDAQKAITVKEGDPYRSHQLKGDARTLQAMIAETGYPHAAVTPVISMISDSSRADVTFGIDEGPLVTMGDVQYVGAFRTRGRVLRRELRAHPGRPLSLKDIIDTQKGVRDLGLFSSVRFRTIGLREKRDTVHVFVEVAEKRPYYGSAGGGYQSDKGLFVHAKAGDRNLLGLNKDAWVGGEVSQIGYRGETGILEPRLLGSRIKAMAEVFGERQVELNQDWGTTSYGVQSGLTVPAGAHLVVGLGAGYQRRRMFGDGADLLTRDGIPDARNILLLTPSLALDRRDSFTRPRKGVFVGSSVDVSKSLGSTSDDFVKVEVEAKGYVTPLAPLTFASVARAGYLQPYGGAPAVPADQRFFLGGTGDVRGFDENLFHHADTTGGNASLSASVEARFEVAFNIELAVFYDIGRLEDDFSAIQPDQFRSSAGAGIRYITPIGPIGILYGWKLAPLAGEAGGQLHFSLGYTF